MFEPFSFCYCDTFSFNIFTTHVLVRRERPVDRLRTAKDMTAKAVLRDVVRFFSRVVSCGGVALLVRQRHLSTWSCSSWKEVRPCRTLLLRTDTSTRSGSFTTWTPSGVTYSWSPEVTVVIKYRSCTPVHEVHRSTDQWARGGRGASRTAWGHVCQGEVRVHDGGRPRPRLWMPH